MPDPRQQFGNSSRGMKRVASATARIEQFDRLRYNGSDPAPFRSDPKQRVGWPIRITGKPSMGTPGLYPAVILEFAGVVDGEPTWEDGDECWAIPYPGVSGLKPGSTQGEPVGVNDEDEKLILVALPPGPLKWVTDVCLVPGLYGATAGVAIFEEFADGHAECRMEPFCEDCTEDEVPDPDPDPGEACSTVYGTVTLMPEGFGVYTVLSMVTVGNFFSAVLTGAYEQDVAIYSAGVGFSVQVPPDEEPRDVYYSLDGGATWTLAVSGGFILTLPSTCEGQRIQVLWQLWESGSAPEVVSPPAPPVPPVPPPP